MTDASAPVLTAEQFLSHWQGHRRLTRKYLDAFPEDQLFTFSIGGMRTFGKLAIEILTVSTYTLDGLTSDQWGEYQAPTVPENKAALLSAWDELTARLDAELPAVDPALYPQMRKLFWGSMPVWVSALYAVDNEIHHRGQGSVYLRSLGIEPPVFYER